MPTASGHQWQKTGTDGEQDGVTLLSSIAHLPSIMVLSQCVMAACVSYDWRGYAQWFEGTVLQTAANRLQLQRCAARLEH